MAVKIRLSRGGSKKRPYYKIVVAEASSPRDGRFIEKVGTYNPMLQSDNPDRIKLVEDRIKYWLSVGAQPTERVEKFLGTAKIIKMPENRVSPNKSKPKEKAQLRITEKAQKEESAAAAAIEAKEAAKLAAQEAKEAAKTAKEAPAEEAAAPVEEAAVEAPAEEAVAEAAPAEEPVEAAPAEEAAVEEAPAAEEVAIEEAPAEEEATPAEEKPAE